MREMILDALVKNAEGCIAIHKANIEIYLNSSTGIGEHSDILEAIQSELDKIAEHQDRLDVLYTHFKEV